MPLTRGGREPGALVMSVLPLDLERRFEQRWAARFLGLSQGQHRLEGQQHQQLTAPGKSKRKTRRQNRPRSVKAGGR
jgi:hypothetical protein